MEIVINMLFLLLVAVINSIDNIGVRIAYSIGGIKVFALKNLLISLMAFAVSFISSFSGGIISQFLSEDVCSVLSMLLLSYMGLKLMLTPYIKNKDHTMSKNEYAIGIDKSNSLSYREAISVGTALALDDIGGSVSIGLIGYNPFMVGLAFFIVSYLIFLSGNYIIKFASKLKLGNKPTLIAGLVLIIIGISQVIE